MYLGSTFLLGTDVSFIRIYFLNTFLLTSDYNMQFEYNPGKFGQHHRYMLGLALFSEVLLMKAFTERYYIGFLVLTALVHICHHLS